jgi:2'-5' RNA ligase
MFVAVWPDDSTLKRLSSLELGHVQGVRLVRPGRWHITLRFLGEVEEDLVPALVDALGDAAESMAGPLRCEVGPETAWFSGERVLQIPVAGLDEGAEAVRRATLPLVPDSNHGEAPFTGHLTVARSKQRRLDGAARDALAGVPFASSFDVSSFDLVVSLLSPEGPRYTTRASVPLRR